VAEGWELSRNEQSSLQENAVDELEGEARLSGSTVCRTMGAIAVVAVPQWVEGHEAKDEELTFCQAEPRANSMTVWGLSWWGSIPRSIGSGAVDFVLS